jgi:putative transferase (TIGR04331 family)
VSIVWNAHRVSAGLDEIEIARPALFDRIKRLLDEYHGVVRSERYYDILLGDFVERYLHLVYVATQDLKAEIESLAKSGSSEGSSEDDFSKVNFQTIRTTLEFFSDYATLPTLTLKTLRALTKFGTSGVLVSRDELIIKNSAPSGRRDKIVVSVLRVLRSGKSARVLFVRPFSGRIPLSWIGAMASWRAWAAHDELEIKYLVEVSPDSAWRESKILKIDNDSSLSEISCALISVYLPVSLVEAFQPIRRLVVEARPNRPDHLYSSQSLWTHIEFKILAAEWCELGTKLHYHQHGGWYGLDDSHVGEQFECRVSDTYFTWGWSRGDDHTRVLSPLITSPRSQKKYCDSLICFDQPQQIYRLQYFPLPGTLQTMYEQVSEFVEIRESKTNLKIRMFPGDYGNVHRQAIVAAKPDAQFGNTGDIFDQYSVSRIVFHSYLGTSWLETLGINTPTICFYDPDAYKFRSDAKFLIEALTQVGILHTSGRSAATHANKIDGNVQSWWLSTDVQLARTNFAEKFANFSTDWMSQWQREFNELLKS